MATGTVIPAALNLRETPGGTIITVLPQGTTVEILEDQGNFLKVNALGQTGFVAAQFIQRNAAETGTVIPVGLNLRETPGGTIITVLPQGTTVEILEDQGNFLKVNALGQTGFVAAQFIQRNGAGGGTNGTVVIDPGHGGTGNLGGSDGNHAVGPTSGVKEKELTLILANLVKTELQNAAAAGHNINVLMTRTTDVNLSLKARANFARDNHADRFVSIHLNASDHHNARGVETWIRQAQDNVNLNDDRRFAAKIQKAVFDAIEARDPATNDRGVKEGQFGVLRDDSLGNTSGGHCRACLLEVEFLDFPQVDALLNIGPNATAVRSEIAKAIAGAIIDDLEHP
jgi:N-acetylmuramoyl-L-alanine amidase